MKTKLMIAVAAMLLASGPVLAQQGELKSLPGGSLMLKEVPAAGGNLQNLPGVRLNMRAQGAAGASNCAEREVSSLGFGHTQSGIVTECTVGNFTFSSGRSTGVGAGPTWTDGVPSPWGAGGPPPGSGGFAPRPNNGLW